MALTSPLRDLKLDLDAAAVRLGLMEVMLIAYDTEGKPLNLVVERSEIRIPEKEYASVQRVAACRFTKRSTSRLGLRSCEQGFTI